MQTRLKVQLSVFMFLQYFIWGSWYVSMGAYLANTLKFGGQEIGAAYGAFAIGSMISPFFVGLVADRYFASEKMLGVLGLLGGVVIFLLPQVKEFWAFYLLLNRLCPRGHAIRKEQASAGLLSCGLWRCELAR